MAWQDDAACMYEDPEIFVKPTTPGGPLPRGWDAQAKASCIVCPVSDQCLKGALEEGDEWTVRGGLNPDERLRIYGRRKRPIHPMDHGTERGSMQHRRRGEDPCNACRDADNLRRRVRAS